jgi:hypothetical protein
VSIDDLTARIQAGEPLAEHEARMLEAERDLLTLGMLADDRRRERHGNRATFVRVADFPVAPDAVAADVPSGAGELRIVGRPATLRDALKAVTLARAIAPDPPLSGFSLADLEALQGFPTEVLPALKTTGLELIAEAPIDLLKSPERAIEGALSAEIPIARLTIQRPGGDTWALCRRAADLQARFGSFRAFAPLARAIGAEHPTTGYADIKRVALARLLVAAVPTIQVDWTLYGPKLAQVALTFGADDLDNVAAQDDQSRGHRRSPLEEIRRNIEAAWLTPVERNARFEAL